MSKKDYIVIARALHSIKPPTKKVTTELVEWELCVNMIAGVLQHDNERFKFTKFQAVCREGE